MTGRKYFWIYSGKELIYIISKELSQLYRKKIGGSTKQQGDQEVEECHFLATLA